VEFEAVFRGLYPSLLRYLHRLTGDADMAEDIAQESFFRLLDQSMSEEEARPWIFTVATNLVRDGARKAVRRQRLLAGSALRPRTEPPPDELVERGDEIRRIRSVLDRIPLRDRQLLLMREEGFRYEEMARVVGVAPTSVGTLIARALKRFTELYQTHEAWRDEEDVNGPSA
jgi:RNA polymerase sigma-70 factor, ECF subfamily